MQNRFLFCRSGGGQFIVLLNALLFFVIFLPTNLIAQTPPTACNDWTIEICEDVKPPANVGGGCGPNLFPHNPCDAVYYYIYLAKTGEQNVVSLPKKFSFVSFNLSGSVIVTPNPSATAHPRSKINVDKSLLCSPAGLNNPADPSSPIYSLDDVGPTNKKFAFKVIDSGAAVDWDVFGRLLLCVLAVDAFPGEIIELAAITSDVKFYNGNVCLLPIDGCDNEPIPSFQVTIPDACSGVGLRLRQGQAVDEPAPGYPNRKKIPVYAFSSPDATTTLDRLDFLMRIGGAMKMVGVSVVPGLFPAERLELYDEQTPSSNTNKRVFADFKNITLTASSTPTASNTLFHIFLDGPPLASDCGSTTVSFTDHRRLRVASNAYCCQPGVVGSPQLVEWSDPPCPGQCNSLEIRAKESSSVPPGANPCQNVYFDVNLKSLTNVSYGLGTVVVEVKYSGMLTWSETQSASDYCGILMDCVDELTVAPGLLQLTFTNDGANNIALTATDPVILIRFGFDAVDACIEALTIRDAVFTEVNASAPCLPNTVVTEVVEGIISDDICITSLTMTYQLHFGPSMSEVDYEVSDQAPPTPPVMGVNCIVGGTALGIGSSGICACNLPNTPQWVVPTKTDNPLNGVTTFDLVLISKHIMGLEPLTPPIPPATAPSPYKLIAADADKSNSVTTFDIVEFRKLILGIYTELPANDSYRFVDKNFQLADNPFPQPMIQIPEWVEIMVPPPGVVAEFYGIKIGDINNTAVGSFFKPEDREATTTTTLGYVPVKGVKGQMVQIPVFPQDILNSNAWQLGIEYDPSQFDLTRLEWAYAMGEMPEQHWNLVSPGKIRVLAYNATGDLVPIAKGTPLFYLVGQLKQDVDKLALRLDGTEKFFPSEAYGVNGALQRFALQEGHETQVNVSSPVIPDTPQTAWAAEIYPNPAGRAFRIQISAPEQGACSIRFYNTLGQLLHVHSQEMTEGNNIITSSSFPELESGQYIVEIESDWGKKSLRLVKK